MGNDNEARMSPSSCRFGAGTRLSPPTKPCPTYIRVHLGLSSSTPASLRCQHHHHPADDNPGAPTAPDDPGYYPSHHHHQREEAGIVVLLTSRRPIINPIMLCWRERIRKNDLQGRRLLPLLLHSQRRNLRSNRNQGGWLRGPHTPPPRT